MRDEEYMEQLALGIDSAFDTLVFRYHKPLYGYIYRLVQDKQVAEDLVQEIFIKVYQQGKKGFVPYTFKPWVYKIATNLCKDYWRKASVKKEIVTHQPFKGNERVTNIMDRQIERQWLIEKLNELSLNYRTVLYLRFYQDFSYQEISLTLDISINTVKSRIYRGLKKLEALLEADRKKGEGTYDR